MDTESQVTADIIGAIPYRMAFAGGWIDQPFISRLNPKPPGSMVVVALEQTNYFMERSGMATGTRRVAQRIWPAGVPAGVPAELTRTLYAEENKDLPEPSGSQDMIGLLYDGVCRLDYDAAHEGGYFPAHIEQCCDEGVARWLEQVIYMLPVAPRPNGYNPLVRKNLEPEWVQRLGQSGKDCYDAIVAKDTGGLAQSMNDCMVCWETLLPDILHHESLTVDLKAVLAHYQARYPGAMYSGCGGGYLYIVSEKPVPCAFTVKVRTGNHS